MTQKNNTDFNLVEHIKNAKSILIVGHMRADGDCLGSGLTIMRLSENLGKKVDFLIEPPLPNHLDFMCGFEKVNEKKSDDYDLLITVDCADVQRMGKYSYYLADKKIKSINIDHHITNDSFGDFNVVCPDFSSTCEIVFDLLKNHNVIDKQMANNLFTGLSTDTGHFFHNNTTAKVFSVAEQLLKLGADAYSITKNIYRNNTINKTKLIAKAINSMRFFNDDSVCIITLSQDDIESVNCTMSDTEGITDLGMNIGVVQVTALISEQRNMLYKVSFRSKSVDVAAAAKVFGGGGHILAAGCQISGHLEDVVRKVVKSITDGM